ncbi:MAG: DUF3048 domain-containing protein [Anaerolineae bacterium]|nr:DUF3048 domain-containing protein [Anaerolineae bacterium]
METPGNLALAPGLLSISNAPVSARPQAGLSYASQVYEFYLGEGASRFLAVFYGLLPPLNTESGQALELGPLRSGRLHYETLRRFYNGYLVFASASDVVLPHLEQYQIIQNPNPDNINGARIPVSRLLELGRDTAAELGQPEISGLLFDPAVPVNGKKAERLWMLFHYYDQVYWKYDAERQVYTRWQDDGEGGELTQAVDSLNGRPLEYENVIVMFADYQRYTETLFNINLSYITRYPALLFRDGQMYEIYWSTRNEEYEKTTGKLRPPRFVDARGNPFPLKPGQSWIEIAQLHNSYFETEDTRDFFRLTNTRLPGSGVWAVYYIPPDYQPTPTLTPTPE